LSKLPRNISGRKLIKTLGKAGFQVDRTEGGHAFLKHQDGRTTTVPIHDPEIGPGLMSDIMDQLKMSRDEFLTLLLDPKKWRKENKPDST